MIRYVAVMPQNGDCTEDAWFRIWGRGNNPDYPDVQISQADDCSWNVVIETRNAGFNTYKVDVMKAGGRGLIRGATGRGFERPVFSAIRRRII